MPIPLLVWGIAIVGTSIGGGISTGFAIKRINDAKNRYNDRRRRYDNFISHFEKQRSFTNSKLEELGHKRINAMITLGEAAKFLENVRLKNRKLFVNIQISEENIVQWKNASIRAEEVLKGMTSAGLSGFAMASAVYGLIGKFACASTGAAISSLSGAVATKATLAWLGGGTIATGGGGIAAGTMVFGGIALAPALVVVSFAAHAQASDVERQVSQGISDMDIDEAKKNKVIANLMQVVNRADELLEGTQRIQNELQHLLNKCNYKNHNDAYLVFRTAQTLAEIIEIPIFDDNGLL